ncbi:hypothetical protein [Saccharopolyspora cebuensis]|uniref:hypothetical protein n=1 Tax=Saccharopolyspora cebuensis TaxID=418759 RepID=UPI00350FACBF
MRAEDGSCGLCGHRLRGRWIIQPYAIVLRGRELCSPCMGSREVSPGLHAALTALQIDADRREAEPLRPDTARQPDLQPTTVMRALNAASAA